MSEVRRMLDRYRRHPEPPRERGRRRGDGPPTLPRKRG
jgi:hypothetical protein